MVARRRRVLVVDDSPAVRRAVVHVLDSTADLVTCGTAGSAAVGALLAADLLPDVVLLDVTMPGGDGFSALEAMRSYGVTSAVVMMSVRRTARELRLAAAAGAAAYVLKTDGAPALLAAIRRAAGPVSGG